jgi:hypothetical protein
VGSIIGSTSLSSGSAGHGHGGSMQDGLEQHPSLLLGIRPDLDDVFARMT